MYRMIVILTLLPSIALADISLFPKWQRVVDEVEVVREYRTPLISDIHHAQAIEYKYVSEKEDYWATPEETERNGGDCEDMAIARYFYLLGRGFSDDDLRIMVGWNPSGIVHAVLRVEMNGGYYYLDNEQPRVTRSTSLRPAYLINREKWHTD